VLKWCESMCYTNEHSKKAACLAGVCVKVVRDDVLPGERGPGMQWLLYMQLLFVMCPSCTRQSLDASCGAYACHTACYTVHAAHMVIHVYMDIGISGWARCTNTVLRCGVAVCSGWA
jgi:hypothetical protein